ncbi:hypothetical protein DEQ92_12120 [Haloferax sp. Atlit-6N]|nr:hypothetical protein DEQ92_12120 [Haloferax sp. Atlit-6N]
MERTKALTGYLTVPCLLYGSAFAIVVTQFSDVVGASTRNSGVSCANCSHSLSAQRRSPPQHVRQ